jgi:hypothetical protein
MSADVVSFPDMWERARKRAEEPSEPHTPFMRCSGVVRPFLALEAERTSPRTSRNRRMQITEALYEAAHPSDPTALILGPAERKMILELRAICPGWEKPKRKPKPSIKPSGAA